jgi:hypothetical protein
MRMSPHDVTTGLAVLHAEYIEKLNQVLDEGRADLAGELADTYTDEALRLITSERSVGGRTGRSSPPA